jgi:hypothetical protein
MAAKLIQIYYRDEQKVSCYPFADLYFNDGLTIFFENECIKKLVMESKADKIGVCSWKLKEKMRYYIGRPRPLTEEVINSDYDVLSFTRNTQYHQMLTAADRWHKGFREAITKIVESIGQRCPGEVKNPIYQNAFMCKREIYQDYVKNWLTPAMELMLNDQELNKLAMSDSNYSNLAKKDAATPEYLQEKLGVSHYPLAPFILERLFSIYVHNSKINVTWL